MARILLIDDEREFSEELSRQLCQIGHDVHPLELAEEGVRLLIEGCFDLVLLDNKMPRMTGLEFLAALKDRGVRVPVILMTSAFNDRTAIQAINLGAHDYVIKPLESERIMAELAPVMLKALEIMRRPKPIPLPESDRQDFDDDSLIIGRSKPILEVFKRIGKAIQNEEPVLILGETGTGKGLVAQAIHTNSARKSMNFVVVNCGALSKELWEDELFGHEKDAFTGATKMRKGCFEHAHGGTIFLDEVGDMPMELQVKLLRVLENREIKRIGSNDTIQVDVRVLAATHKNLATMVREGKFREDLFFRLEGMTIPLPPLRERKEDIPLLARRFLSQMFGGISSAPALDPDALAALCRHPWQGNIRTLHKVLCRAAGSCRGSRIVAEDLEFSKLDVAAASSAQAPDSQEIAIEGLRRAIAWAWNTRQEKKPWPLLQELLEAELLRFALNQPHDSEDQLAKQIGIVKNTLRKWKEASGVNKADGANS